MSRLTARVRVTYVLNWALLIATVLVFVSGILISENALPALGLTGGRGGNSIFGFWHQLHILSADAVLVLSGIHLGLNWRWVVNAFKHILPVGSPMGRTRHRPAALLGALASGRSYSQDATLRLSNVDYRKSCSTWRRSLD